MKAKLGLAGATRRAGRVLGRAGRAPGRLLRREVLLPPVELVAPMLLGKLLVHFVQNENGDTKCLAGRIVEVEAYLGPHHETPDPAAHSYRGITDRNRVMFGPPGHAYVYSIYGMYYCMNVTCEQEGRAGCVLVRALEPVAGIAEMARNRGLDPGAPHPLLTSGPGRLCQALGLTRARDNGLDLLDPRSPLQLRHDGFAATEALVTVRIGIRHAAHLPLRFALPGNRFVSGRKSLTGKCVPIG